MAQLNANIPEFQAPFLMPGTGNINPVWYQFLLKLFARTGGPIGSDSGSNEAIITDALTLLGSGAIQPPFDTTTISDSVALAGSFSVAQSRQAYAPQPVIEVGVHGLQTDPALHALATTTTDGFMSAADKTFLASITPLLPPVDIVANVVGANSTADFPVLSLSVPASTFSVGSFVRGQMGGEMTALSGAILQFYFQIGATKFIVSVIQATAAMSSVGVLYSVIATQRAANALAVTVNINVTSGVAAPSPFVQSGTATFVVASANTITMGFNWTAASPSNSLTISNALLKQEK